MSLQKIMAARRPAVFLARSPESLARLCREARNSDRPDDSDHALILTLKGWLACTERGIPSAAAGDFFQLSDWSEMDRAAFLARGWSRAFAEEWGDALVYRGLDLWNLIALENLICFRELIFARRLAQRIFARWGPLEYRIAREPVIACLESARHQARHGVCEPVLADALRRLGAKVHLVDLSPRGRWPWLPLRWKQSLNRAKNRALDKLRPGRRTPTTVAAPTHREEASAFDDVWERRPDGGFLIHAFGTEVDVHNLAALTAALRDESSTRALGAPIRTQLIANTACVEKVTGRSGLGDKADLDHVIGLPSWFGDAVRAKDHVILLDRAWKRWERWRSSCRKRLDAFRGTDCESATDEACAVLSSQGADIHFRTVWRRLRDELLPHIDRVQALWDRVRPDGVLVANVERSLDRATAQLAEARGITTCAIPHGYLGDMDHFDFGTKTFLAWGRSSREGLIAAFGKPALSVQLLAPQHLLRLPERYPRAPRVEPWSSSPDAENPPRHRLLVLSARTDGAARNPIDPRGFVAGWEALGQWLQSRPDVQICLKPHPGGSDQTDYYESWSRKFGDDRIVFWTDRRMEDVIGEVDAVLGMIDPSTAFLVAALYDVPTLYARLGWRPGTRSWAVTAFGLPEGLESVEDPVDLAAALDRLFDDPAFRRHCRDRGRAFLEAQCTRPDGEGGSGHSATLGAVFGALGLGLGLVSDVGVSRCAGDEG